MASVTAIRNGLKSAMDAIPGLRNNAFVVGDVVPPATVIIPGDPSRKNSYAINYDSTMGRGSDDFYFTILLMVANKVERTSQEALDGYLAGTGPQSIKTAIEADPSLGGVACFVNVTGVRDYGLVTYGGQTYVGAEFMVEVTAQNA